MRWRNWIQQITESSQNVKELSLFNLFLQNDCRAKTKPLVNSSMPLRFISVSLGLSRQLPLHPPWARRPRPPPPAPRLTFVRTDERLLAGVRHEVPLQVLAAHERLAAAGLRTEPAPLAGVLVQVPLQLARRRERPAAVGHGARERPLAGVAARVLPQPAALVERAPAPLHRAAEARGAAGRVDARVRAHAVRRREPLVAAVVRTPGEGRRASHHGRSPDFTSNRDFRHAPGLVYISPIVDYRRFLFVS